MVAKIIGDHPLRLCSIDDAGALQPRTSFTILNRHRPGDHDDSSVENRKKISPILDRVADRQINEWRFAFFSFLIGAEVGADVLIPAQFKNLVSFRYAAIPLAVVFLILRSRDALQG